MRDYAELAAGLRYCSTNAPCEKCPYYRIGSDSCFLQVRADAADAIEELLSAVPRWISVEERLPEINQPVLICAFGRSVGEGMYYGHDGVHHVWKMDGVAGTYWDDEVTHWMPLPAAPPKEDTE